MFSFLIFLIPGENEPAIENVLKMQAYPAVAAASTFEIPKYYYSIDKKSHGN